MEIKDELVRKHKKDINRLSKSDLVKIHLADKQLLDDYSQLLMNNGSMLINAGYNNLSLCNKLTLFENAMLGLLDIFRKDLNDIDVMLNRIDIKLSNRDVNELIYRKKLIENYVEHLDKNIGKFYHK